LPERDDAAGNDGEVRERDTREFVRRRFFDDAQLRRGNSGARLLLRNTTDTARVTFGRDGQRRFTALQEDVLRREAAVGRRTQR
jgi:hypothetical protein